MEKTEFKILKRNILSKKIIIFGFFIFLAAFLTNLTFIGIFFSDKCTNYYFDNIKTFKNAFGSYVTPSKVSIVAFLSVAFFLLVLGLILFLFSPLLIKMRVRLSNIIIYISIIIILLFLSSTFFAVAEYNYYRFTILVEFVTSKGNANLAWSDSIKKQILDLIQINSNTKHFSWTTNKSVWWFNLFRILVIMIYFAKILFDLGTLNIEDKKIIEKIERKTVTKRIGKSKAVNFFSKIMNVSQKNLSMWIIITTTIIALPQIVYLISLSHGSGSLNSLLVWINIAPALLKSFSTEYNKYGSFFHDVDGVSVSFFEINQIQMILLSSVFAFLVLFAMYYIREWEVKIKIVIVQSLILFVFLLMLILSGFYSMIRMADIYDNWQNHIQEDFEKLISDPKKNSSFMAIFTHFFPNKNKDDFRIEYNWPHGIELVSLIVISIGILITTLILFVDIFNKHLAEIRKSAKTLYFEEDNWYL
ncbi:hypothetical protein [Spiroplasma endosymbiont of Crioceris asparagi]|uniref:hypothetical protein n=1 Tax=Spiroplasma endosymbiont of Crioceris asparagi TaxID=3066286 RepID=UPI0030D58470